MFTDVSHVPAALVTGLARPDSGVATGADSTAQAQARTRLVDALANALGSSQGGALSAEDLAEALLERADPDGGVVDLRDLPSLAGDAWVRIPAAAWEALDGWMTAQGPDGVRQIALPSAASAGDLKALPAAIGGLKKLDLLCLMAPHHGLQLDLSGFGPQVARPRLVVGLTAGLTPCEVLLPQHLAMEYDSGGVIAAKRLNVHRVPGGKDLKTGSTAKGETPLGLMYFSTPRHSSTQPLPADGKAAAPLSLLNLNARVGFDAQQSAAVDLDLHTIVCRHISLKWIQDRQAWQQAKQGDGGAKAEDDFYTHYKTADELQGHVPASIDAQVRMAFSKWERESVQAAQFGEFLARELGTMKAPQHRHFMVVSPNHAMAVELRAKQRSDGSKAYVVNFYDPNRTATHLRIAVSSPDRLQDKPLSHWLPANVLRAYGLNRAPLTVMASPALVEPGIGTGPMASTQEASTRTATDPVELAIAQAMVSGGAAGTATALAQALGQRPVDRERLMQRLQARDELGRSALYVALRYGQAPVVDAFVKAVVSAPDEVLSPQDRFALLQATRHDAQGGDRPGLSMRAARHSAEGVAAYARGILGAPAGALTPQQQCDLLGTPHAAHRGLAPLQALALNDAGWHASHREGRAQAVHVLAGAIAAAPGLTVAQKARLLQRPASLQTDAGLKGAGHDPSAARTTTAALITAILESELPWADRQALAAGVCADPSAYLSPDDAGSGWGTRLLAQLARADVPAGDAWAQALRAAGTTS